MRDLNRITFDPEVMQGQACIRGMRIPVSLVVNLLSNGRSEDQIISDFQTLSWRTSASHSSMPFD